MLYPNELSPDFILPMPTSTTTTLGPKPSTDGRAATAAGKLSKSHKPGIPRPASIRHSLGIGKTGVSKALADVINHDSPPKDTSKEPRRHSGLSFGSRHASASARERDSSADADREGSVYLRRCKLNRLNGSMVIFP